jgi:hypothetical protein
VSFVCPPSGVLCSSYMSRYGQIRGCVRLFFCLVFWPITISLHACSNIWLHMWDTYYICWYLSMRFELILNNVMELGMEGKCGQCGFCGVRQSGPSLHLVCAMKMPLGVLSSRR